jgi:hypothetical protein
VAMEERVKHLEEHERDGRVRRHGEMPQWVLGAALAAALGALGFQIDQNIKYAGTSAQVDMLMRHDTDRFDPVRFEDFKTNTEFALTQIQKQQEENARILRKVDYNVKSAVIYKTLPAPTPAPAPAPTRRR